MNIKIVFLCSTFAMSQVCAAKDYIVALSPLQPPEQAQIQVKESLKFATELDAGDKVAFIDGFNLRTIGTFVVPEGKNYTNPKARLAANGKAVGALLNFAKSAATNGEMLSGALRLPQLLRHVAENYRTSETLEVIVLGSPLYHVPGAPEFSMREGLIPSDGHLQSSRAKTPYGIDSKTALSGLRVHVAYGNEPLMQSDRHQYFVSRFWTLFVERQGGALVTFAGESGIAFQRAKSGASTPAHGHELETSDKLIMIRLRTVLLDEPLSIYQRVLETAPLAASISRQARGVQIGLSWDCSSCDLDLYARKDAASPLIYFAQNNTPDGVHVKDFMTSPRAMRGFETIEMSVPVDLHSLQIAVNFYSGHAPQGVRGELRLAVEGKTFARQFHIPATTGSKGVGAKEAMDTGRTESSQTLLIDPLAIAGLR